MKFLLATLATMSIGAPVVSVTANAVSVNNIMIEEIHTGENLSGLRDWTGDYNHDLAHEEYLTYLGQQKTDGRDNKKIIESTPVHVSKNYSIENDVNDSTLIDGESENNIPATVGSNINPFILEGKTFMATMPNNPVTGEISWVGQTTDENGNVNTYQRNTGIQYTISNPTLNKTPSAIPFTYFGDKTDDSRQSFIIGTTFKEGTAADKTNELKFIKVNRATTSDSKNDISNKEYQPFGETTSFKVSDLNLPAPENGQWTLSTFIAQDSNRYDSNLEKTGMLNRVIIGFYNNYSKAPITEYFAFNVTADDNGKITLNRVGDYSLKSDIINADGATNDFNDKSYRLFATLDNGDVIFKLGTGENAVYALGSYFVNGSIKKIASGKSVMKALGLNNKDKTKEEVVSSMFSTVDNKLIFQIKLGLVGWTDLGMYNSDFYYVNPIDDNGNLNFEKKGITTKLFSTDEYTDPSDDFWKLMEGNANVITGEVKYQNSVNTKYKFIATVSVQQKVIVYKYTDLTKTNKTLGGINDDLNNGPKLETIYQTIGNADINNQYQANSLAFVDNSFLVSNSIYPNGSSNRISFLTTLTEKISNSDISKAIGNSIELVQDTFNNILAAYPDKFRNSEIVRYVFLQALVTGKFTYSTSYTDYPFNDNENEFKDFSSKNILNSSLIGGLSGDYSKLTKALLEAKYEVDGKILDVPFQKDEADKDTTDQIIVSTSGESMNNLLRYKHYGSFDYTGKLILKSKNKNSLLNGEIAISVKSAGVTSSFDVDEINENVKESIKKDFSDFNIDKYNTPSEVTGYILNKINDVIYNEERIYSGDKSIPKLMSDFQINSAITNKPDEMADSWNQYRTTFKENPDIHIYNDPNSFDGKRPLMLTTKTFDSLIGNNITEKTWRNQMDWGWQDSAQFKDENGVTTVDLTNIVLTSMNNASIGIIRSNDNVIRDTEEQDGHGILYYGDNEVDAKSVLLNIGETTDDGKTNNHLRATVSTSEVNKINDVDPVSNYDSTQDLDTASETIKNSVVEMDDNEAKTSVFRYFEKIKKQYNLKQNIQLSMDFDQITNENYFVPEGDVRKYDIIIYDALFFSDISELASSGINLYDPATQKSKHFKVISIYVSNGQNKTKNKSIVIFASIFGTIIFLLFTSYTIYISMRKSFYKRGTTREAAKEAATMKKILKSVKHKKDENNK
jgi:hypothetical protein